MQHKHENRPARMARDLEASEAETWSDQPDPSRFCQGHIVHVPSEQNNAMWTPAGGGAFCADPALATAIEQVVAAFPGADGLSLVTAFDERLQPLLGSVSCRLDIGLYGYGLPEGFDRERLRAVEFVAPNTEGLPELPPEVEHVAVIRDGGRIVSWASSIPQEQVDDHCFHSLGAGTDPAYRRRGFAMAVVGALLDRLAADGDAAWWVYEAHNTASHALARKLGFFEHFWVLNWTILWS